MTRRLNPAIAFAAVSILASLQSAALAHSGEGLAATPRAGISTEEHAFGVEGDPAKARRTVAISMDDTMRYSRTEIRVRQGETLTLAVSNRGKLMHELVIGTEEQLRKHAELMVKNPEMEHEEPYMAHVRPGSRERLTWKFTKPGTFYFGCLVPGHFEAGMKGRIVVDGSK